MIIDQIKAAKVDAMKQRNDAAKGILSLLADRYLLQAIEAKANQKEIGDVEMTAILMKVGKELEDERATYFSNGAHDRVKNIDVQISILKQFLPKLLSEADIRAEIKKLADQSLPSIMKHFKTNFAGKVDMGLVNQIAKTK
ncbi:MAG: GatB/YqeY domain-containing protein [Firmicutes bacterium]|nr:GatB/YqeY domain-containing protein [Bacillota bacterium]